VQSHIELKFKEHMTQVLWR